MPVDVHSEIEIARTPDVVARYAADPENAPRWYVNIESAAWQTEPPLGVGSRFAFVARFLRRRLAYTYEVVDYVPQRRLAMRTSEGPFPMETTYTWEPIGTASTRMGLTNRGEPAGFSDSPRRSWHARCGVPTGATSRRSRHCWRPPPRDEAASARVGAGGRSHTPSAQRTSVRRAQRHRRCLHVRPCRSVQRRHPGARRGAGRAHRGGGRPAGRRPDHGNPAPVRRGAGHRGRPAALRQRRGHARRGSGLRCHGSVRYARDAHVRRHVRAAAGPARSPPEAPPSRPRRGGPTRSSRRGARRSAPRAGRGGR